ncbi:AmmeMemoRadiSam system radical SAM enzyme [Verrucomicrobiota bacterium]
MKTRSFPNDISRRRFLTCLGTGLAGCTLARALPGPTQGSQLHEAAYYEKLDGKKVRCTLCPKRCVVNDGQRGYCRVRENRGGRYYTLVYGRPCATHLDPVEKKPLFHVYPGSRSFSIATVGCNMECKFCQNWDISQASPQDVSVPYRSPADIAREAKKAKARTIAYTYTEPTVFHEYMVDCAKAGLDRGVESVMISAGLISAPAQRALFPVLKAVKIDLKAFTQSFYTNICEGFLQPVLDSLKRLSDSGVWYEIVVLIIPTLNDSDDEIKRMTEWIVKELGPDVPVHFSRYHPTYKMQNIPPTPVKTLLRVRKIALDQGCHFVYIGNAPVKGAQDTFCPFCKKLLIKRYGYRILEDSIVKGHCKFCGKPIPGVWG